MAKSKLTGNMRQSNAVLVVGPAWVGDMVMAQSLYKTIKRLSPETEIDVLAPAWSAPLLSRMPEVRRAIVQPVGHGKLGLMSRLRLGRQLSQEAYRQAYIIPRSLKAVLTPFFARIPVRTGYRGEMRYGLINDVHLLDKTRLSQTAQRYVALAYSEHDNAKSVPAVPHPQLEIHKDNQELLCKRLNLARDKPIVAIIPGAEYGPAKQWSADNYTELARRLIEKGVSVWVLGSEKDIPGAQYIQQHLPQQGSAGLVDLCGKTRLEDAVDLLALAAVVVTNDSGLMHVAASANRPIVAIYGSSTPAYTPPLSNKSKVIYKGLDCSPCFKRQCPLQHTNCLNLISVNEVYDAVAAQMKKYQSFDIEAEKL